MVTEILNTPDVFKITDPQDTDVRYDVSDLLPFTSTHINRVTQRKAKDHKSLSVVKPYGDSESALKVLAGDSASDPTTIAELLVQVDSHTEVAAILDASPLKNIVDSYWEAYQKLFAAAFVIHVVIMSIYSYLGIVSLNCLSSNSTLANKPIVVRLWHVEFGLALSIIWPICLLIYDTVKLVKFFRTCHRFGSSQTTKKMISQRESLMAYLILQLCGFTYSTSTIIWYAMNRWCFPGQDYVLAISYIFGWVYSINFTRGFKHIHHFSIILQHILFRDMLRFGFIYLFILLAFSFAYAALVQAIPTLKLGGADSIFLVFNWMIGMTDFETDADEFKLVDKWEPMVKIVYSSYIILSTIVLINLLIAMMSDSYAHVRRMSEVMWKVGSLRLPLEFEEGLGRSHYRPAHLYFDDVDGRWYIKIPKRLIVEKEISSQTVIHDLTMKVERLVQESSNRESRVLALLESKTKAKSE